MIVLYTDFGWEGPYVGQMKAVLAREAPEVAVIDLMHDAPAFSPRPAGYLLAALAGEFPLDTVFVAVIDPGVGDPARRPAAVRADGRWFVGPDNGLFNAVAARARHASWWDLTWRPGRLSTSFHGRDLFAPVGALLARGEQPPGETVPVAERLYADWPDDLAEVIYIDHYGNCVTGFRASMLPEGPEVRVDGRVLARGATFAGRPVGEAFWYENSAGLVELAANQARADVGLGLAVGDPVDIRPGS